MSSKELIAEYCAGLTVHGPPPQQLESPETGSTRNPNSSVPDTEKMMPQQGEGDTFPLVDPNDEVFNVEKWVSDLNQSLQKLQGHTAAQIAMLIKARRVCDTRIQKLTEKFLQSENELKTELQQHPTKKAHKKILRTFDPELRSVNKQVEEIAQVRKQVESQLTLLAGPCSQDQPLSPVLVVGGEVKKGAGRPQNSKFCRDLFLCLLLSMLIFFLVFMLMFKAL